MKTLALIAALLVISAACVKPPAQAPEAGEELGELGVQEEAGAGLDTMPEYTSEEETSLVGEPVELGSLI